MITWVTFAYNQSRPEKKIRNKKHENNNRSDRVRAVGLTTHQILYVSGDCI